MLWTLRLAGEATGLAWVEEGARLIVTSTGPSNRISLVRADRGEVLRAWSGGAGVCSPVVSVVRNRLYVCNRFIHAIGVHDLDSGMIRGAAPPICGRWPGAGTASDCASRTRGPTN